MSARRSTLWRRAIWSPALLAGLSWLASAPAFAQSDVRSVVDAPALDLGATGIAAVFPAGTSHAADSSAIAMFRAAMQRSAALGVAVQSAPAVEYDAWGARRNFGLAVGEVAMVNAFVWAYNEYIRGASFTQVNPRSWLDNLKTGLAYDDNQFANNQFAHPFHGSLYYNSGRTNGLGYWESAPLAIMGSFFWECCGETHVPAINDWIATSIGGTAIGELTYRASSAFLDNEATGAGRIFREIATTLMNPLRGFNRAVSGRWTRVYPNPSSPYDRIPPFFASSVMAGVRVIGDERSLSGGDVFGDTTEVHGVFEFDMRYGSPFDDGQRKPFDWFNFGLQINFGDKTPIGRLQIQGNLYTSDMKVSEKTHHVFSVSHMYDYINNNAFEFGSTSFSAGIFSRFKLSEKVALNTNLEGIGTLMGAVNSEFAFRAELPDTSRLREYDYGPGLGAKLGVVASIGGWDAVTLSYRLQWIHTLNGSVGTGSEEAEAEHIIQAVVLRLKAPIYRSYGIGGDVIGYVRNSYFSTESDALNITQRVPQVRLYIVINTRIAPGL